MAVRRMAAADVLAFLRLCDDSGAAVWLDGGWACDALLQRETRPHDDLDIVIERRHTGAVAQALRAAGYHDIPRDDTQPWNFVLGDDAGHEVDFHVVELDAAGNGLYSPPDRGVWYPAASLAGCGVIAGRRVRCISADWLVRFHTGYPPEAEDRADVAALCAEFGLPVPGGYERLP